MRMYIVPQKFNKKQKSIKWNINYGIYTITQHRAGLEEWWIDMFMNENPIYNGGIELLSEISFSRTETIW